MQVGILRPAWTGLLVSMFALSFAACAEEKEKGEEEPTGIFREEADIHNERRCPEIADHEALVFNEGFPTTDARRAMTQKYNKSLGDDTLVQPGDAQVIEGRFWGGADNFPGTGWGPEGLAVRIFHQPEAADWVLLGEATTTEDGYYSYALPTDANFDVGSHRILSILEADGTCVEHGVFVYDEGRGAMLTDIDATLTTADSEMMFQMFNDLSHIPPKIEDSDAMCLGWDEKGYLMLYLTARPHDYSSWTRTWLREEGYPFGPVQTAPGLVNGSSAAAYKGDFVSRILDEVGWEIHFGFGNAESDVDGYTAGGLPAELIYTVGDAAKEGGYGGSNPLPDSYTDFISTVLADYPDAD